MWNDVATVGHLIIVWFAVAVAFVGNFASRHSCGGVESELRGGCGASASARLMYFFVRMMRRLFKGG